MRKTQSGYEYDGAELALIYSVLDDEYMSVRLGRAAEFLFKLLKGAGYLLPIILILAFMGASLSDDIENNWSKIRPETQPIFEITLFLLDDLVMPVVNRLVMPTVAALAAILVVNGPLFWKAYRQWRLSRRLTALELIDIGLQAPSRFPRIKNIRLIVLLAPTSLLTISLYTVFSKGVGLPIHEWWKTAVALILLVFLPAILLFTDSLFRRLQVRLDYIKEVLTLRNELEEPPTAGSILTPELVIRLADVERAHILRASADASRTRLSDLLFHRAYAVRKSDSASAVLAELVDTERVKIERALEDLANRQRTAGTQEGSPCTLDVRDTPWRVTYEVQPRSRIIYVTLIVLRGKNEC